MNEIQRQVKRARNKLILQQFVSVLSWSIFAGLIIGCIALLIPKLTPVSFVQDAQSANLWTWSWIGGTAGGAILFAIIYTWLHATNSLNAAVEIDRRFGLKERVSSALMLDAQSQKSEFGQALIADANQRAERIDIGDQFAFQKSWRPLLPVAAAVAIFVINLFQYVAVEPVEATEEQIETQKKIQVATEATKKELQKQIKQLSAKGLEETKQTVEKIEREIDRFQKMDGTSKRDALAKINDLKKQVQDQRNQLGNPEEVRKMLAKMSPEKMGPAKQLADSLQKGDIDKARDAIKKLAESLNKGDLSQQEKEQLQKQLDKMAEDLKKAVADHKKSIEDLQQQLKQAQQQGDQQLADKLKEQLQKQQSSSNQMDQMNKLADGMKSAAECLRNSQGDLSDEELKSMMSQAAEGLEQMDQQLGDVQKMMAQSDALSECEGSLGECQGMMNSGMASNQMTENPGNGLGAGRGEGDRPISENETGNFLSRVRANPKEGEKVISGRADGANSSGISTIEARQQIKASMSEDVDPSETQRLGREQRDHVKEYFQKLREGGK
jgi:septal ring factor EnvC (AmiA/AmiB activator)